MSHAALVELTIEHLRGSIVPFTLLFEKGKKLTIIYGENGTGKSTVCDAFDLLGNGKVGSLNGRGLGTTRPYWHSVGKTPADVKVTLKTSAGECIASLGRRDVAITNDQHRPRVEALRRSQILSLVEAKPAERYSAISRFIDVSGVEASEASLRKLIIEINRDLEFAVTRVSENREQIDRFWVEAGMPGSDSLTWATQEIKKDQSAYDQRKEAIDKLISSWDSLVGYPQKNEALSHQLKLDQDALQSAQEALAALTDDVTGDYLEVLELLRAAQRHFISHPSPTVCPLCESGEKAEGLVVEVNRRIEAQNLVGRLEELKCKLNMCDSAVQRTVQRLDDLKTSALNDVLILEDYCKSGALPEGIQLPILPVPVEIDQWSEWFFSHKELRQTWKQASDECIDNKKFIGTLRTSLNALQSNEQRINELVMILPLLKQTLMIVESERKNFTDEILEEIAAKVGELYEVIHPEEGMNKISLELDAAKRASLEISTEFAGQSDAPPQAYFSDSHLDTLGLCVFLALAERDMPNETILVLDDVLGSVDEPHVDRVIGMLYDEASKFRHCLITTHYGPWRHKYRWGWLKNGQCHFVELTRWSLHKGITHIRSVPEAERLRGLLASPSPDLQSICAKSGVILEAVLDFLTQLYECYVPRRPGGVYTLGDLLPAIDSKLKKALRVEHKQEDATGVVSYTEKWLEPHINELSRIAQVRNVSGCHFNALSFDLLDNDAIHFGTEVLALIDALVDHEIGWPRNSKSGSYWATTGETRRLHPLKKPS
jgi:hypothetical protein